MSGPYWSEILPGLYISGYGEWPEEVMDPKWGLVLCVLEVCKQPGFTSPPPPHTVHIPIMPTGLPFVASVNQLNAAADLIKQYRDNYENVLVHCGAGIERSPLTVAWYLARYGGFDLDGAYLHIKIRRPIVQDRQSWLPWTFEGKAHP